MITVGAGLAACGGTKHSNPPALAASSAAMWQVETVSPGQCTATPCGADGHECTATAAKPYACIAGVPSAMVIRQQGERDCAYNSTPSPPPEPCPPDRTCNPPPPQWTPVKVSCP